MSDIVKAKLTAQYYCNVDNIKINTKLPHQSMHHSIRESKPNIPKEIARSETKIHIVHSLDVTISGQTYIEPGVPYNVTCTVNEYRDNRKTTFIALIPGQIYADIIVWYYKPYGCFKFQIPTSTDCRNASCACDDNGLATHWIYTLPSDLSTSVTFKCATSDNDNKIVESTELAPTITGEQIEEITVWYYKQYGCFKYKFPTSTDCLDASCACDDNGLATHWIYTSPSDLSTSVTFQCESSDNDNKIVTSNKFAPTITVKHLQCESNDNDAEIVKSQVFSPTVSVPISSVTLSSTPTDENPVKIIKDQSQLFNCKTNAGRPSSIIQWYMDSINITLSATSQSDVCATDCSDGKLISSSQLIYKGNTNDSGHIIYCTASNIEGHSVRSLNKTIDVLYFPYVHMEPKYNPYIVSHKQQNIVLTCVIDDANPADDVTYEWNSPSGTVITQNLTIPTANHSHTGQYSCTATNIAGTSHRTTKQLIVNYAPLISNVSKNQNIIEGNNLEVSPIVDANPVAKLVWWTRQNDATFKYVGSVLKINNIYRTSSGNYSCYVMNTLTPSGMATINRTTHKTFYVDVVFKPLLNHTRPYSPLYVTTTENSTLHLTLTLSAHPTPTMEWTFRGETDWNACNFVTITSNTTTNGFITSSFILIDNINSSYFGDYILTARNIAGVFFHRFVVMEKCKFEFKTPL
ncbi:unnamed protein product [Mytilus coruscus]|uniref:Ig-like domain-containing protein n=1 Tax=Mytilus coruscus TaxID=42192 RepID=A0A6J8A615_MYTCO|nr:unnamed protein product [Mytilus coruscus]